MERLIVKNFLLLEDVDIKIKKYNFLLGPQASGKSVFAKLLYFIYNIPTIIRNGIEKELYKEDILDNIKNRFKTIFPESYWNNEKFQIIYHFNDFSLRLENKEGKLKTLDINVNKPFENIFENILNISREVDYKNKNKSLEDILDTKSKGESPHLYALGNYVNSVDSFKKFFKKGLSIFIPSSRCVYSILADKPATNSKTFSSDHFLNEFGELYEGLKGLYDNFTKNNANGIEFKERAEKILKGKYLYEKKMDYISIKGKKISVKNVSSGQQEILPLLIIIGLFSTLHKKEPQKDYLDSRFYFIEEPEAHLFPEAQAQLMSLLSFVGYESDMPFFITTHSPYLLSILNNFLYGTSLIDKKILSEENYVQITGGARPIRTDEINAFTLKEGISISLMDEDGVFIQSDVLDSASTIINDMYDNLVEYTLKN